MRDLIPRSEFGTLTNRFFNDLWNELNFDFPSLFEEGRKSKFSYPKLNIKDDGSEFVIEAGVPGLTEDDVSVEYSDGLITIRGESQNETNADQNGYVMRELHKSSFSRSFRVDPDQVNLEMIDAHVENGVLVITIPKVKFEQKEIRKIPVKRVDTS